MSDCGITHIGATFSISTTTENADLDASGFEALTYTQVPNLGNMDATGIQQNSVSFSTWDRQVLCKGKGEVNAGDPTVEFLDVPSAGIDAMETAADFQNTDSYAFEIEYADGSKEYNRGLVMGPERPKGANEDFKRLIYTLGLLQAPVIVDAPSS